MALPDHPPTPPPVTVVTEPDRGPRAAGAEAPTGFRPDVEGLRALAILLVLAYHASVPPATGGFVGVDVFFVISGYVITGVLFRSNPGDARSFFGDFYARRARRIVPAVVLVIVATTLASYHWLGFIAGDQTATDGKWAVGFLANFHFSALGTNYLASQTPASPLQNFWSLAVEEQFYLAYPAIFLLVARARSSFSPRPRLAVIVSVIVAASLAWSVVTTRSNAIASYFSPFTRAWELGIGALVAIGATGIARLPARLMRPVGWCGVAVVLVAATRDDAHTVYPGFAAMLPVIGTALVIGAGESGLRFGPSALLAQPPVRFVGRISYSLDLWHWPILAIVARYFNTTQSWRVNALWLLVAVALSIVSYLTVEQPIQRSPRLTRGPVGRIALGRAISGAGFAVLAIEGAIHP